MFRLTQVSQRLVPLQRSSILMPSMLSQRPRLLQSATIFSQPRFFFAGQSSNQDEPEAPNGSVAEPQIEIDEEYEAKQRREDLEDAYRNGGGTERRYDFAQKRLTITNYESVKSEKISTVMIDGKDKSVSFLATETSILTAKEMKLRAMQIISETYLPKDFPDSVSKEFLPFTIYSLIGSTSTSAMLFLSTQSLFVALGGSSSQSQLAAAAYTWVLKDGIGQLGGILFASRYGGYFDEDVKKWRFIAISTLNFSVLIEIMTLKFPHLFLFLASIANMCKNICFLMAAASRAQINMRFAKRNNIADIAGKSVSLFTTSSLLGMGLGIGLSKLIDISQFSQMLPVFGVLTFINLYFTYNSANLIEEIYLNNQRSKLLFDDYLAPENTRMPTMKEINDKSNFTVPNFLNRHYCRYIRFGEKSVSRVISKKSTKHYYVNSLMHQLHKENRNFVYYIQMLPLWKRRLCTITNNGRPYVIHVNMKKGASNKDQLAAYYLSRLLDAELYKIFEKSVATNGDTYDKIQNSMRVAELNFGQVNLESFIRELEKQEWSMDYIYLDRKKNLYEYKLERVEQVASSEREDVQV